MASKKPNTTSSLDPKVSAALCYVPFVGWVPAVVFLLIDQTAQVRWHAIQSLILFGVGLALMLVLNPLLSGAITVVIIVLQLILAVKAYQGEKMRLPLLSDWVDKMVKQ